ncbi:MAG: EamA family transporter [Firmicutes bacterium]|nr:EamA family transporter [Bacillota bacterium]
MTNILLYIGAIAASCAQSAFTKQNTRRGDGSAESAGTFNLFKAVAVFAVLLLIFLFDRSWNAATIGWGAAYGVLLTVSMITGYYALKTGPMALTSMIVSFSLLIPYAYGIVFLSEKPKPIQVAGLGMFILALVLINWNHLHVKGEARAKDGVHENKDAAKPQKVSGRWAMFTALTLAANGFCSIVQKGHQNIYPGMYTSWFMAVAGFTACILFLVRFVWQKNKVQLKAKAAVKYGILSGTFNGVSNLILLVLAATENASILYPVISAGTMLSVFGIGRIVFKEKMSMMQTAGFAVGLLAIVLLKAL